ncbi:RNA-binding protein [Frigidibacter sp. ROC022]|uniref:RNA-binding protein n=1 Tax=Frigidibacter sp. ROC022 TaxID=2971796 RepID=UPI00215B1EAF|nr:RNA-binding protein [Frigidibacter sp. ROC022]MCR8724433.1 RNA-binding protein [Frigidibacter sp. ROC022]
MTRGGRRKETDEAERRCIVSGDSGPKAGLIRFVIGPEGQVVPDILGKLPGRGIYVGADRASLTKAAEGGLFARAAKAPVVVPDGLVDAVERQLTRRLVELVSMARKAGLAVAGFEKVKDWLAKGRAKVLLQASDGSERGKSKLWTPEGGRFFGCLTSDELGLAFGRESVIHAALAAGGLTRRVIEDAARLAGVRSDIGAARAGKDKTTT